jgi:hypothetical protein
MRGKKGKPSGECPAASVERLELVENNDVKNRQEFSVFSEAVPASRIRELLQEESLASPRV